MSNKIKGKYREDVAVNYLIKNGYKILDRNYHFSRYGEVDIIAYDKKENTLCFVEVKARSNDKFGSPLEAITALKLAKIYKCALSYLPKSPVKCSKFRIDAIAVILHQAGLEPEIDHIKNIEF